MIMNPTLFALGRVLNAADPTAVGGSIGQDVVFTRTAAGIYVATFNRVLEHQRMVYQVTLTAAAAVAGAAMVVVGAQSNFIGISTKVAAVDADVEFSFMAFELSALAIDAQV